MADLNDISATPNGLGIKPKPQGIVWLNQNSVVAGSAALAIVVGAIIYGGLSRGESKPPTQDAGLPSLVPATPPDELAGSSTSNTQAGSIRRRRALTTDPAASSPAVPLPVPAPGASAPPAPLGGQHPLPSADPGAGAAPGAQVPLSPAQMQAQRREEERANLREQAIKAGTVAGGGQTGGFSGVAGDTAGAGQARGAAGAYTPALQQLQALAGAAGGGAQRPALAAAVTREEDDPNGQARKASFLRSMEEAAPGRDAIKSTRQGAISPYEVKAGWLIPAMMEHGINSDLPGQLTAMVTQNVFDTATGRYLLIPQGARLVGAYDSQVTYGQDGLMVAWRRIIFPDGSSLNLEGMGGMDESGYAGFRDEVNNHYGRLIGFGVLTSLLSAAFQISQTQAQAAGSVQSPSQVAGTAVAQNLSQLGIEVARKNLRVQPTITIRPGYQFNVRVDRDLIFSRGYASGNAQ